MTNEDYDERKWKMRSTVAQVLATVAKNSLMFTYGFILGLSTMVIPAVQNAPANSTLSLTDEEVSWFGSIGGITNTVGCLASGVLNSAVGRKRSMQVLTIPLMIVCCIYHFANSAYMLCAAEALTGLIGGLSEAPVISYVSEISEPRLRGITAASTTLSILIGLFFTNLLGSFMYWRNIALVCVAFPILTLIVIFFIPESPHWLMSKKRFADTQEALCWLRGWTTKDRVQDEYNQLFKEMYPETTKDENELSDERKRRCTFILHNFFKKTFLIPFALIFYTMFICHFTGVTTLGTYTVNIFNSFGSPISGYRAAVVLGITRFLGVIVCIVFVQFTGKRPLLFLSVAGLGVLTGGAGLYGYLYLGVEKLDNGAHVHEAFQGMQRFSWFPDACLTAVPLFGYFCLRPLPWLLIGEVYPMEIRGVGSGMSAAMGYVFLFATNKTFFGFINFLTLPGVFLFYAVLAFASLPVFYFFLPETEGWSLVEVQEHFAGKRNLTKAGKKKSEKTTSGSGHDNPLPVS